MKPNPIVWFEIYVKDMNRAKRFYESVFQTKLTKLDAPLPGLEMWRFPSDQGGAGASGALIRAEEMPPSGGLTTLIYFHCEDCAVEEKRVKEFGGRIQRSKTSIGEHGAISLVYDTEGNMIGLHSM